MGWAPGPDSSALASLWYQHAATLEPSTGLSGSMLRFACGIRVCCHIPTVEAAAQCADRWISYPQRTPAATDSGGETQSLAMGHSFSLLWPLAHQE